MALIGKTYLADRRWSSNFRTIVLKTAQKRPFFDPKSAVERARRLKMQRNLFVVMRVCSSIVLSYLDASFEPQCVRKDFLTACCLRLLAAVAAKTCRSSLDPKWWCKTSTR